MAKDTTQVLLGPGTFYVAAVVAGVAEPAPADPTVAPGVDWEDIGYSTDGWNLVNDLTYEFFTPAEEVDPIATLKSAQECHFLGIAAQFSLDNLKIALGGGTITTDAGPPATQTYVPPSSTGYDRFSVLFRTAAPGTAKIRDIYVPFVISMSSVDIPHTKGANPSVVAIDMRALKVTGDDLFTIVETT